MIKALDVVTLLPLISPPFTTSIAFVFSFGPRGLITHDLFGMPNAQVYGLTSTLTAEALTYFPLAYLALRPLLRRPAGISRRRLQPRLLSLARVPHRDAAADDTRIGNAFLSCSPLRSRISRRR